MKFRSCIKLVTIKYKIDFLISSSIHKEAQIATCTGTPTSTYSQTHAPEHTHTQTHTHTYADYDALKLQNIYTNMYLCKTYSPYVLTSF